MSSGAPRVDAAPATYPMVNGYNRSAAHGPLSVRERQEQDMVRRESRYRELVAKVEEERRRVETFAPVINRRVKRTGIAGNRLTPAEKSTFIDPEETFHPVINSKSERMAASGARRGSQPHLQEVRQRVQELWRAHAGVGNGEITVGGVYAALKELGLQPPSPMVDKFLQALGINEASDIRSVAYDRFVKVFTVVLRAALVSPTCSSAVDSVMRRSGGGGNGNGNNDDDDNKMKKDSNAHGDNGNGGDGGNTSPRVCTANHLRSVTLSMRRAKPEPSRRESIDRLSYMSDSGARKSDGDVDSATENRSDGAGPRDDCSGAMAKTRGTRDSPPCGQFPATMTRRKSLAHSREGAFGTRIGLNRAVGAHDIQKTVKKAPYDPLEGCTFAPAINRRGRSVSSAQHTAGVEAQTLRSAPTMVVHHSMKERELEECTFAPNTACFHKNRGSLAWWVREPFVDASVEATSSSSSTNSAKAAAADKPSTRNTDSRFEGKPQTGALRAPSVPISSGFDKAVQRMISARKKCRPSFEEMLRSSTCSEEPSKPPRPTVVEPFTLHAVARHLQREQQKPLLYVDVDLPSGRTGRIGVHRGDQAADLARGFSQAYGLNEELCGRLECLLTEKLNEFAKKNAVRTLWL